MKTTVLPVSRKGLGLLRVLFLCEDNHCWSRFCEELFNSLVRGEGLNWQAVSRAVSADAARRCTEPMAIDAIAALRMLGAAPVNHRRLPLAVTAFDLDTSHTVVVVDDSSAAAVAHLSRELASGIEVCSLAAAGEQSYAGLAASVRDLLARVSGRAASPVRAAIATAEAARTSGKLPLQRITADEQKHAKSNRRSTGRQRASAPSC